MRLFGCLVLVVGVVTIDAAQLTQILPTRGPYGFYPVGVTSLTNGDELEIRLSGMIPNVNYLIMARSNCPYAQWFPIAWWQGSTNGDPPPIRINLTSGEIAKGFPWTSMPKKSGHEWRQMQFTAGSDEDYDGDGLPDLYEDLVTRTDPLAPDTGETGVGDGYKDPDHDNWANIDEYKNRTDPFSWNSPPAPEGVEVLRRFHPGSSSNEFVTVKWYQPGVQPEFFNVYRKEPVLQSHPQTSTPPGWRAIAKVAGVPGVNNYQYDDTNVSVSINQAYYVNAYWAQGAPRVLPARSDSDGIRQMICPVACEPTPNGYQLTVKNAEPFFHYLMLVRDGDNDFWKASGFFTGGQNGAPLHLVADKRGMLVSDEGPFYLPKVVGIPKLDHPQFTCGSGEDADGDGLPDIYEVLVTKTDPSRSDTGNTGLLDGYKDLAGDGWTALEKYRRRVDPLTKDRVPSPIELVSPSSDIITKAIQQIPITDLGYDLIVQTRNLNGFDYHDSSLAEVDSLFEHKRHDEIATNLAVRITLQVPKIKARSPR